MKVSMLAVAVAACALTVTPAHAQKAGSTVGGITAGINSGTFTGSDATGVSSHTGFMAGGVLEHVSGSMFYRAGVAYSQRGAESGGVQFKLNYIEIPVLLGYRFNLQGSQFTPYVMAGGQFDIKASCNVEYLGSSVSCDDAAFQSAVGKVSSTDYGFTVGGGASVGTGNARITIDARYLFGMQNVLEGFTIKNAGFTIAAGYMIPLGH